MFAKRAYSGLTTKQLPWSKQTDVQEYRFSKERKVAHKKAVRVLNTLTGKRCPKGARESQSQMLIFSKVLTALRLYELQRSNGSQDTLADCTEQAIRDVNTTVDKLRNQKRHSLPVQLRHTEAKEGNFSIA